MLLRDYQWKLCITASLRQLCVKSLWRIIVMLKEHTVLFANYLNSQIICTFVDHFSKHALQFDTGFRSFLCNTKLAWDCNPSQLNILHNNYVMFCQWYIIVVQLKCRYVYYITSYCNVEMCQMIISTTDNFIISWIDECQFFNLWGFLLAEVEQHILINCIKILVSLL